MKLFWPATAILAIGAGAAIYVYTPELRKYIPDDMAADWALYASKIKGVEFPQQTQTASDDSEVPREIADGPRIKYKVKRNPAKNKPVEKPVADAPAANEVPANPASAATADGAQASGVPSQASVASANIAESNNVAQTAVAPQERAANTARARLDAIPEEDESSPGKKGIEPCIYRQAKWGVVNKIAPYRYASSKEIAGHAGPGSTFIIESATRKTATGFFPLKKSASKFEMDVEALNTFTGSYDSLSTRQKTALKEYFKLKGEAAKIKSNTERAFAMQCPFYANAVELTKKLKEMQSQTKELMQSTDPGAPIALERLKGERLQLETQIKELSAKYKAWKEQNSAKWPKVENSEPFKAMARDLEDLAAEIPGLVN